MQIMQHLPICTALASLVPILGTSQSTS